MHKAANIKLELLNLTCSAALHIRDEVEPINLDKTLPKLKRDIENLCRDYGFDFKPDLNW